MKHVLSQTILVRSFVYLTAALKMKLKIHELCPSVPDSVGACVSMMIKRCVIGVRVSHAEGSEGFMCLTGQW